MIFKTVSSLQPFHSIPSPRELFVSLSIEESFFSSWNLGSGCVLIGDVIAEFETFEYLQYHDLCKSSTERKNVRDSITCTHANEVRLYMLVLASRQCLLFFIFCVVLSSAVR